MASNGQPTDSYTIRCMQPEETEEVYEMIDKEGWNLALDKFSLLSKAFPNKFYVAVTDQGEIAGTMSLYPTFDNEYVLGNLVVKENHRGRGLGKKLIRDIVARHHGSVISLTAVPGADQFYLNTGFHTTQSQQGHDIFHMDMDRDAVEKQAKAMNTDQITVLPFDDRSMDELVAYDEEARGYRCKEYVEMQTKCAKVFIARDPRGKFVGYSGALIKRDEILVDGLFADSDAIALLLMTHILKAFPDRNEVKLQVPSSRLFLSELGLVTSSYRYNRYSIGSPTPSSLSKVYNVTDCDYTY